LFCDGNAGFEDFSNLLAFNLSRLCRLNGGLSFWYSLDDRRFEELCT